MTIEQEIEKTLQQLENYYFKRWHYYNEKDPTLTREEATTALLNIIDDRCETNLIGRKNRVYSYLPLETKTPSTSEG
jgi:hypothetical protein